MPELEIAIGSIKYNLSCKEEEKDALNAIVKRINKKINNLSLKVGRVNDKILLIMLLLINAEQMAKFKKDDFESKVTHIFKVLSPLLRTKSDTDLEGKLIVANIVKENEIFNNPPKKKPEKNTKDVVETKTIIDYEAMIGVMEKITGHVGDLEKSIKNLIKTE